MRYDLNHSSSYITLYTSFTETIFKNLYHPQATISQEVAE